METGEASWWSDQSGLLVWHNFAKFTYILLNIIILLKFMFGFLHSDGWDMGLQSLISSGEKEVPKLHLTIPR